MAEPTTKENAPHPTPIFTTTLKHQLHAVLEMLRGAIQKCPEELWTNTDYTNPYWRLAYHALFYTHQYMHATESDFAPWERGRENVHHMDAPLETNESYTKKDLLEYCHLIDAMVDETVDGLDLLDPESGFSWKKISRADHQFASVRHSQHHAGQLLDRLRTHAGDSVEWLSIGEGPG